jgi:hypothetical protein
MVRENNTPTPEMMGENGTAAVGLPKNEADLAAFQFVMGVISDLEAKGASEWRLRDFVTGYLKRWGAWLERNKCEATLSLLRYEAERWSEKEQATQPTSEAAHNAQPQNTTPPQTADPPAIATPSPQNSTKQTTPKPDPKKAPPASEWVYKAGTPKPETPEYDGLFASPPPDHESQTQPAKETTTPPENTTNGDDSDVTDDDVIHYTEGMLMELTKRGASLKVKIWHLEKLLENIGEEMKQKGLMRAYNFILAQILYHKAALNVSGEE